MKALTIHIHDADDAVPEPRRGSTDVSDLSPREAISGPDHDCGGDRYDQKRDDSTPLRTRPLVGDETHDVDRAAGGRNVSDAEELAHNREAIRETEDDCVPKRLLLEPVGECDEREREAGRAGDVDSGERGVREDRRLRREENRGQKSAWLADLPARPPCRA